MLRSAQKKERQIWIDPYIYFTAVQTQARAAADTANLILYINCVGKGGCWFNEEKLMRFLKVLKIYRADKIESSGPSPIADSYLTFGKMKEHLASKEKSKFSSFFQLSDFAPIDKVEGEVLLLTQNLAKNRSSHQRCRSDLVGPESVQDAKAAQSFSIKVVMFSLKDILFELADGISLEKLVNIAPATRISDREFFSKQLMLLLRMTKPLITMEGQDSSAEWTDFLTSQSTQVFSILESSSKNTRQELLDAYKEFLFQKGLAEMQLEEALKIASPLGNPLRSLDSLRRNSESLQTTVKKQTKITMPISETLESLLIGIFTSISNDPSKKETFYCLGIQKYSQLNYNSLLDLTIHFLTNEFSKSFGTDVTSKSLMNRLKELKDPVGIESFKHTGDLCRLHAALYGTAKDSPVSQQRSKQPKCQVIIEKAPSFKVEQRDDRPKRVRGNSVKLHAETLTSLKVPGPTMERLSSGYGELLSCSKLSKNEEVTSLHRSRVQIPNESPARPPFKQIRPEAIQVDVEDSTSILSSQADDQMYASFFEDNWHVLKNDIRDAIIFRTAKVAPQRDTTYAKQIYHLLKDENINVIIAATQLILRRIDVKAFNQVIKRQSRQSNQFIQSPREKSNKEFH
jgi:hypothetical protein